MLLVALAWANEGNPLMASCRSYRNLCYESTFHKSSTVHTKTSPHLAAVLVERNSTHRALSPDLLALDV